MYLIFQEQTGDATAEIERAVKIPEPHFFQINSHFSCTKEAETRLAGIIATAMLTFSQLSQLLKISLLNLGEVIDNKGTSNKVSISLSLTHVRTHKSNNKFEYRFTTIKAIM